MEILKNHNSFTTERERQQRDILIAAIDNLVDFAAAEEYAMLGELPETADEQDMEAYEKICRRYNLVHAEEENNQVFFAASMAAWWMAVDMDTVLTYMTQGDERDSESWKRRRNVAADFTVFYANTAIIF